MRWLRARAVLPLSRMKSDLLLGAAAGAVGGLVGSTAMVVFNHLLAATGFGRQDLGARKQQRHVRGKPNQTDATISDEPASERAASLAVKTATGEQLGDIGKKVGGTVAHHAFGAFVGAVYGAAAARTPQLAAGAGAPYGVFVWLSAVEIVLPLAGFAKRPTRYRPERHLASLASHVVFGLTLEGVRRLMSRTVR